MPAVSKAALLSLAKKYKYLFIVLAAGLALILWPFGGGTSPPSGTQSDYPAFSVSDMEKRVGDALGAIEGAGRVNVVLTLHADMHILVQEDVSSESRRQLRDGETEELQSSSQRKTVVVTTSGSQQPIVTKRIYPEFKGALIVCDGGDKPAVRLAVIEAVSALTGLGSDKISVFKMRN